MRDAINTCEICKRARLEPYKILDMPSLPKERIKRAKPFENTGTDYAGPFIVKINGENKKVWVQIFTCMATRFTHLELIPDLTAKSCLQSFRRFCAEYGRPKYLLSDNGT